MVSRANLAIHKYYGDDKVKLEGGRFKKQIYSDQRLGSLILIDAKLDSCVFENLDINNVTLGGGKKESFLENCHFVNSKLNIVLGFSTLINYTFEMCHHWRNVCSKDAIYKL